MELFQRHEREIARSDGRLEQLAIFYNIFVLVPLRETEIENTFTGVETAHTSAAGAEAVNEPLNFFERSEFKNLYATDAA
jgi:hypothetical protein